MKFNKTTLGVMMLIATVLRIVLLYFAAFIVIDHFQMGHTVQTAQAVVLFYLIATFKVDIEMKG